MLRVYIGNEGRKRLFSFCLNITFYTYMKNLYHNMDKKILLLDKKIALC